MPRPNLDHVDGTKVWEADGITVHCVATVDPISATPHVSYHISDSETGKVISEVDSLAEVAKLLELRHQAADEDIPVAPI